MTSIAQRAAVAAPSTAALPLPERLHHFGAALFATDALAGLTAIAVCGVVFHAAIAAFFTVTAAIFVATAVGRYRISFAVFERDEWYATIGVAMLAAFLGMLFSAIFGFAWLVASVAAAVWAVVASYCAARWHHARRLETPYAGTSQYARTGPRSTREEIEQAIIRVLDVVFAIAGTIVLLPVMFVIVLAVVIDDGAPALFGQCRVGRDDREFTMLKVRTMRRDADATWVAAPGDDRITRVGSILRSTSLDELPQLFNVVRGEMSLVGPRPEMVEYAAQFGRRLENYWQRHRVSPGITGWAQLYLPRTLTPDDAPVVLSYDLFYVEHVCVYLYLQCLIKTASEIVLHKAL